MKRLKALAALAAAACIGVSGLVALPAAHADDARYNLVQEVFKRSQAGLRSWIEKADGTKGPVTNDFSAEPRLGDTVVFESDPLPADATFTIGELVDKKYKKGEKIFERVPITCANKDKFVYNEARDYPYVADSYLGYPGAPWLTQLLLETSIPITDSTVVNPMDPMTVIALRPGAFSSCGKAPAPQPDPKPSKPTLTQKEIVNIVMKNSAAGFSTGVTDSSGKPKKVDGYGDVVYGDVLHYKRGPLLADAELNYGTVNKGYTKFYERGETIDLTIPVDCSFKPGDFIGIHSIYQKRDNPPADYPRIVSYGEVEEYTPDMIIDGGTDVDFSVKVTGDYSTCDSAAKPPVKPGTSGKKPSASDKKPGTSDKKPGASKKDKTAKGDPKAKSTQKSSGGSTLAKTGSETASLLIAVMLLVGSGSLLMLKRRTI